MMIFIGLTQIWAAQNLIYEEKKSVIIYNKYNSMLICG